MKVGKAIYNILSQSTDVQSNFPFNTTDYAPTGTELVQNGSFTDGVEKMTNGDFSAGVEGVVGGNFESGLIGTLNGGGAGTVYTWALNTVAPISGTQDGLFSVTGAGSSSSYPRLGFDGNLALDKSYVLTFDYKVNSGTCFLGSINRGGGSSEVVVTTLTGSGTFTLYFQGFGTGDLTLNFDGTELFETQFDNVSIKELGEDWTINDGWSIGEDKAIWDADSATQNENINQSISFGVNKSYKVTFTIDDVVGSPVRILMRATGVTNQDITASWEDFTAGTYTRYFSSLYSNTQFDISGRYDAADSFSITNITVQELGEGWTVENTDATHYVEFIETGARFVAGALTPLLVLRQDVVSSGKFYKISCEATYAAGSGKARFQIGSINTSSIQEGSNTLYLSSPTTANYSYVLRDAVDVDVVLTNISIEEMALTKIFPELAPPNIDAPYVVYSVVSNSPSDTKNANGDIDTASIEVYGFQDTYNKAVDLGVSVRAALDRKTGTYNTIEIQSTNYVNEQMDVNEARKLWAAIQDYSIRIKNI